ncbi:MAG: cyclase family protein, partial [Marinirhabdus sp.]
MRAQINIKNKRYTVDLSKPLDISISLRDSPKNPTAWYLPGPCIQPVKQGDWVGKVSKGAPVNFNNISFNPHAHGTHTECVGHISEAFHSVNQCLKTYFFLAEVVTVTPKTRGADLVIPPGQLGPLLEKPPPGAVVLRTLPNAPSKKSKKHAHTNWPYVAEDTMVLLRDLGVKH